MWTDSVHGVVDVKKSLAGTIERTQSRAARVDESLIDIEKE
jgi:hypothetical protein